MEATATAEHEAVSASTSSDPVDRYRADYRRFIEARTEPDQLSALRKRAFERFERLGFPTLRDEEWRNTNIASVARTEYRPAPRVAAADLASASGGGSLKDLLLDGCRHVVLVNGRYMTDLSESDFGEGCEVASLRKCLSDSSATDDGPGRPDLADRTGRPAIAKAFGRTLSEQNHPFAALNTALFRDGVVIRFRSKAVVDTPVQILHLAVADGAQPRVTYPRTLILAEELSQGTVVETYATLGEGELFSCPVTEIACEQSATLRHYRHQRESEQTAHLAVQRVDLERSARLSSLSLVTGAAVMRNDMHALIEGEGVECVLDGLYVVGGRQLVDHHMRIEHIGANSHSHELFKGILDDRARAVFNGRIYVHKPAQKTDAVQTNRNLLLSDGALVNSNPQLEIFADDVKCTHGSTIGQLDPEAIFYLRTRGVDEQSARSLLIFAFASELTDQITVPALRAELEELLYQRLPGGDLVRRVGGETSS